MLSPDDRPAPSDRAQDGPTARHESELTWLSLRELAARIRCGDLSAREALADQLARIDAVDPLLNAVVTRDDECALAAASAADEAHAAGRLLGPLHGVPLTHKESTDVAGWRTTRGSRLLIDNIARRDAPIIERLHRAGVVTSGKTNVPEFTAGSHTFNALFGITVNPYDTRRSAGGSSGGAAAAIAAGVQAGGDGSDMGGSLRTPASFTNLVGLRASNGRIPHIVPANPWQWLAQPGFMARTVDDLALLMSVASGPAAGAPCALPEPGAIFHPLDPGALGEHLAGLRIGLSPDLGGLLPVEPEVAAIIASTAEVFDAAGARVDETVPDLRDADQVFRVQRAYDFAADYRHLVREHRTEIRGDVVRNTDLGLRLSTDELIDADEARIRLQASVEEFFSHHDLLVLTTSQLAPFDAAIDYPRSLGDVAFDDYLAWMRAATIISATGCPAISVPAGFTGSGLPVGVQLVARPGDDLALLRAAAAFEQLTAHHVRRPALRPGPA